MNDLLQQDVSQVLTNNEKKRHSLAAQSFISGAKNYLINYNFQIQKIIDVDKMKQSYEKKIVEKGQSVQDTSKNAYQVQKESNKIFSTVLFVSSCVFLSYGVFKIKIDNFTNVYKKHKEEIDNLIGGRGKVFKKTIDFLKNKGIDFKSILRKTIDVITVGIVPKVLMIIVQLIDKLFNGVQYSPYYGAEEVNFFQYLLTQVGEKVFWDISGDSWCLDILRLVGAEINKSVKIRPKLHAYLKYGRKFLNRAAESAHDRELAQGNEDYWNWNDKVKDKRLRFRLYNNENFTTEGAPLEADENDDSKQQGWPQVSERLSKLFTDIYDIHGAKIAKTVSSDMFADLDFNPIKDDLWEWRRKWFSDTAMNADYDTDTGYGRQLYLTNCKEEVSDLLYDIKETLSRINPRSNAEAIYWCLREYDILKGKIHADVSRLGRNGNINANAKYGKVNYAISVLNYADLVRLHVIVMSLESQTELLLARHDTWYLNKQGAALTKLYRQESQRLIERSFITTTTAVKTLTKSIKQVNIDFSFFKSKMDKIFIEWSKGRQMFRQIDSSIENAYEKLNYIKIIESMRDIGKIFEHFGFNTSSKKGKESKVQFYNFSFSNNFSGNTNDYSKNFSQQQSSQPSSSLQDCKKIIENYFVLKRLHKKVRENRLILLNDLLYIIKRIQKVDQKRLSDKDVLDIFNNTYKCDLPDGDKEKLLKTLKKSLSKNK